MKLTRRNALIGMGTVAAGAGVIGGTGAFTSVEAERSVSVSTAGDADAALAIKPVSDGDDSIGENSDEYTNADNLEAEYDTITIQVDGNNNGNGIDNGGLNIDAKTRIEDLFTVSNNGTQEVEMSFSLSNDVSGLVNPDGDSPNEGSIKLLVGDGEGSYANELTLTGGNIDSFVPSDPGDDLGDNLTVGSGSNGPNFGLEFDIPEDVATSGDDASFSPELTIRASSTS